MHNRHMGAAPVDNLDACYERCRLLTKRHGTTYYFSARFFPRAIRRSIFGLYGFTRVPDEMVDNPEDDEFAFPGSPQWDEGDDSPNGRAENNLLAWQAEFEGALTRGDSHQPVMRAFIDTLQRHSIPPEYPRSFLASMLMDLTVDRYATIEDLVGYTHGSASVIGLMICAIVGLHDPAALPRASDLGLAMQLTNFLRDIGEDYQSRGRIYLPQEDLYRFGYSEKDLAAGVVNDRFRELMRFEIARNREVYARAELGIPYLPDYAQFPIRLAAHLYAGILGRIEAADYDIFSHRVATSKAFKARTALALWAAQKAGQRGSGGRVSDHAGAGRSPGG